MGFVTLSAQIDLMPLPAEKGLKLLCESDDEMTTARFDAPSSRKRIETQHRRKLRGRWRDLMPLPAEKGLKPAKVRSCAMASDRFDAPSSRKRIETPVTIAISEACKGI